MSSETVLERSRNKYFYVSPMKSPLQVPVMKTIMLSDYCLVSTDLLYVESFTFVSLDSQQQLKY